MLTISFDGQPKARALILDVPVSGVSGVVECAVCSASLALTVPTIEEISNGIERFIKEHECESLARREEVMAFAKRLKGGKPRCEVRVMKGRGCVKES